MQIAASLAARVEVSFALWGGLISIDGTITWTDANTVGRAPRFTLREAQYFGALAVLKKLRALREQNQEASLMMLTDSQQLVEELTGAWAQPQRASSAALDEAITLVRALDGLTLRYCSRAANLEAHAMITRLCQRHGVPVKARFVREGR